MFELTDQVVSIFGIYFKHSKDNILFLYPQLDLRKMDFFKVVCNGQLVDEETVPSSEPKESTPAKDAQDDGGALELDESEAPQLEDVLREEAIQEENLMT